ncbi:MAG: class I SAM-dependent methyltransferase [Kiritimatiellia bacterium]
MLPYLGMKNTFAGTILDFGCGLGDAIPVYRRRFPKARLLGMDISPSGVNECRRRYGGQAEFLQGGAPDVPSGIDVIITSNVLEHLDSDVEVVRMLLQKCSDLYVLVPYREAPLYAEHVRSYDEHHFSALGAYTWKVFACRGWSAYGMGLWYGIRLLNIYRFLANRPLRHRALQILFHFKGARPEAAST